MGASMSIHGSLRVREIIFLTFVTTLFQRYTYLHRYLHVALGITDLLHILQIFVSIFGLPMFYFFSVCLLFFFYFFLAHLNLKQGVIV
ncbi:hypothetical protein F4815DRAFT_484133 [Daldinia loculata]|nr:hypothetical protein F4815DRAFT_484133 [Daldinia loculata]